MRDVFEQVLANDRGFVFSQRVVTSIDHCSELSGALGFRELGVEPVVHAVTEDDLEGGKVGVGSEDGRKLFKGAEFGSVSQLGPQC